MAVGWWLLLLAVAEIKQVVAEIKPVAAEIKPVVVMAVYVMCASAASFWITVPVGQTGRSLRNMFRFDSLFSYASDGPSDLSLDEFQFHEGQAASGSEAGNIPFAESEAAESAAGTACLACSDDAAPRAKWCHRHRTVVAKMRRVCCVHGTPEQALEFKLVFCGRATFRTPAYTGDERLSVLWVRRFDQDYEPMNNKQRREALRIRNFRPRAAF